MGLAELLYRPYYPAFDGLTGVIYPYIAVSAKARRSPNTTHTLRSNQIVAVHLASPQSYLLASPIDGAGGKAALALCGPPIV